MRVIKQQTERGATTFWSLLEAWGRPWVRQESYKVFAKILGIENWNRFHGWNATKPYWRIWRFAQSDRHCVSHFRAIPIPIGALTAWLATQSASVLVFQARPVLEQSHGFCFGLDFTSAFLVVSIRISNLCWRILVSFGGQTWLFSAIYKSNPIPR